MKYLQLRPFVMRTVIPLMGLILFVSLAVFLLLLWSSARTNQIAIDRQESLLALVLSQSQFTIAHDQESATVWDDAVNHVKRPDSAEWIDSNLGRWMHTYFGHDAAYILNGNNEATFAFADGKIAEPSAFQAVKAKVAPLALKLRDLLRNPNPDGYGDRVLSPGASEIITLGGRPAIVSVKPIVSDTGNITQTPDETFLHVAVRYLDESFIAELQRDYLFTGLRYATSEQLQAGEHSYALKSSLGQTIGYFIWKPYRPGSTVMYQIAPTLIGIALLMSGIMAVLLAGLRLRSLKLRASEDRLNFLALHDSLTGLANRAHFVERLDRDLANVRNACVAVLYLDLDRFKQVNDTLGHPVGDELIRELTERLKSVVHDTNAIARIGGDEFTVIVPNFRSMFEIETLCERIITAVRSPFNIDGNHIFIGVSIGVATAPHDGIERAELVRKADIALYHAKSAGRGRYAIFGKEMDVMLQERRTLERELREALRSDSQLQLHYQPLYSARERKIIGVEALLRWHHPERGMIAPDVFIPIAEEAGLIEALGERVLRQACTESKSWPIDSVAVNVSAVELRNPAYAMKVAKLLLSLDMEPKRLELEVTETAFVDTAGHCEHNIRALRALGIKIALDDFGTGFSSLGRLQQLEVDRIKIDRSFIQGFGQSANDEDIVKAIVDLAHAKGLRTTAEGVETVAQSDYLSVIGCDDLQGFLLSRPIPVKDLERLFRMATSLGSVGIEGRSSSA
jgi:diguanylate cyclase (GGDEF)-like protein